MKNLRKTTTVIALSGIFFAAIALGCNALAQKGGGRPQGPPPEAYTACEGKNAGDAAEFISPHGDTVTGICELQGDLLVLRPDNPSPNGGRMGYNSN